MKVGYLLNFEIIVYIFLVVTGSTKPGRSAFVRSRPQFEAVDTGELEGSQGFGTVMQQFVPIQFLGKRVRMRAWLRYQNVIPDSWCGLWLRIDEPNGKSTLGIKLSDLPLKKKLMIIFFHSLNSST